MVIFVIVFLKNCLENEFYFYSFLYFSFESIFCLWVQDYKNKTIWLLCSVYDKENVFLFIWFERYRCSHKIHLNFRKKYIKSFHLFTWWGWGKERQWEISKPALQNQKTLNKDFIFILDVRINKCYFKNHLYRNPMML